MTTATSQACVGDYIKIASWWGVKNTFDAGLILERDIFLVDEMSKRLAAGKESPTILRVPHKSSKKQWKGEVHNLRGEQTNIKGESTFVVRGDTKRCIIPTKFFK